MLSPATAISILVLASLLLGLARDLTVAYYFGAAWQADLYFLALIIPLFVESSLAISLRDSLVPALLRRREEGGSAYTALVAQAGGAILLLALGIWGLLAATPGLWLGLVDDSGMAALHGLELLQSYHIGIAMIPLFMWLYFLASISHANGAFVLPAWRGVAFNVGGLLALLLLSRSPQGLLAGMFVGLLLHVVLLQASIGGVRPQWPRPAQLREATGSVLLRRFLTLLAVALLLQLAIGAERLLANLTGEGGLSRLSYAFRIVTVPLVVFSFAVMGIAYTRFSHAVARGDERFLGEAFADTARICALLLLPTAVALTLLAQEVVSLLLHRGAFTAHDVRQSAQLMQWYAAGLPAMGFAVLLTRMLVVLDRFRPLLLATSLAVACTGLGYLLGFRTHGIEGLALVTSAGAYLQCALLWLALPAAYRRLPGRRDLLAGGLTLLALAALLPLLAPKGMAGLLGCGIMVLLLPAFLYWLLLRSEFLVSLGRAMGRA